MYYFYFNKLIIQSKMKKEDNINEKKQIYKEIGPYIDLGLNLAITIAGFVLLGWWLDNKFEISPVLTLIFSFLGMFIGFFNFIRTVIKK